MFGSGVSVLPQIDWKICRRVLYSSVPGTDMVNHCNMILNYYRLINSYAIHRWGHNPENGMFHYPWSRSSDSLITQTICMYVASVSAWRTAVGVGGKVQSSSASEEISDLPGSVVMGYSGRGMMSTACENWTVRVDWTGLNSKEGWSVFRVNPGGPGSHVYWWGW